MKRDRVIKSIQSASMVPFSSEFPDLALKEALRIIAKRMSDIPDGQYLFLDSYCDDPDWLPQGAFSTDAHRRGRCMGCVISEAITAQVEELHT